MRCDLFIVLGSSLSVFPAADFPLRAKQKGAALVIVNRDPTEMDEIADLVIHASIGETMGAGRWMTDEVLTDRTLARKAQQRIEQSSERSIEIPL